MRIYLIIFLISSSIQGRALSTMEAGMCNPDVELLLNLPPCDEREWVEWLLRDMPTIDLMSINADSFLLDLKALKSNLDSLPWTGLIPEDIFIHYVLPYRVSQEPLEYFRLHYGRELYERVKDCPCMKSAALAVNEWAYEKMKYEPTERWDQSAEITIKRGIGRCEEMAILYIKACRLVGIPTRNVWTPYWPFTNSNHAWVEVWAQDGWHFIGAAEMTSLNDAWFRNAVRRAAIIKGIVWGDVAGGDEIIYSRGDGFTVLNLTPDYTDTIGLFVTVRDFYGMPVESADVWVSVFNYSSIRGVAHKYTDESGKAHITMGKADLLVSSGKDSLWDFDIVRFSEDIQKKELVFTLGNGMVPDTSFWLGVKEKEAMSRDTSYRAPEISRVIHNLNQERLKTIDEEVLGIFCDTSSEFRLLEILNRSRGNRETLIKLFKYYREKQDFLLSLWDVMHTKDLIAVDTITMRQIIEESIRRQKLFHNYGFPDSLFFEYVANPRILWETLGIDYRLTVEVLKGASSEVPGEVANEVLGYIKANIDTLGDKNYFGGMMNPYQTIRARTGSIIERLLVFVEIVRRAGIPARIGWDYESAEYYDGDWISVRLADVEKEVKKGVLVAEFIQNRERRTDVRYYEDFSLCKLKEGRFRDITPALDTLGEFVFFAIPYGEYYFITGFRTAKGNVFVRIHPVNLGSDTVFKEVILGFPPPEAISPFALVVRDFKGLSDSIIVDTKGDTLFNSSLKEGDVLLAFFDPKEESSISTARRLASIKDIPLFIFVKTTEGEVALLFCQDTGLKGRVFYGEERLKQVLTFKELPSILFLKDGRAILWVEGLNLEITNMIKHLRGH